MAEKEGYRWQREASGDEQQGYENAVRALSEALHSDDKTSDSVMQMLRTGDDPLDSIARAATMVITELDKQIDIPEEALMTLAGDAFDLLHEMGDAAGLFTLTPEQERVGVAATQETLLRVYGMDAQGLDSLAEGLNENDVNELADIYQEATNNGERLPQKSTGGNRSGGGNALPSGNGGGPPAAIGNAQRQPSLGAGAGAGQSAAAGLPGAEGAGRIPL